MKYRYKEDGHIHEIALDDANYSPAFGTTSVIKEVYPPPLAWYGSGKALEPMGFITAKKEPNEMKRRALLEEGLSKVQSVVNHELALDKFEEFLNTCYKNHDTYMRSRGKAGKERHALIEKYIKTMLGTWNFTDDPFHPDDLYFADIKGFIDWSEKNVEKFLWSEGYCCSANLFCGGISDFGFIHKNGMTFIGDAKPSVYPSQFIQTGGYSIQMAENGVMDKDGNKLLDPLKVDGFMIWDYEKNEPHYLIGQWVAKLESDFRHTVEMYKRRDLIGSTTLPTASPVNWVDLGVVPEHPSDGQ